MLSKEGRHARNRADLNDGIDARHRRLSEITKVLVTTIGAIVCLCVLVTLIQGYFQRAADASTISRQRDALLKAQRSASDAARNSSNTAAKVSQLAKLLSVANQNASDSRAATASLQDALAQHGYSSVVSGGKVVVIKGPLPKSLLNAPGASNETSPSNRPGMSSLPNPSTQPSLASGVVVAPGLHRTMPSVPGAPRVTMTYPAPARSTYPRHRGPAPSHRPTQTHTPSSTATATPTSTPRPTSTSHPTTSRQPTSTIVPPLPIPTVTVTVPGLPPIVLGSGLTQATQSVADLLSGWVGIAIATPEGAR